MTLICTSHAMKLISNVLYARSETHPCNSVRLKAELCLKVLQKLLGHSSIKTTMDRYVHVTDASLTNAIKQFEQNTSLAKLKMVRFRKIGAELVRNTPP